MLDKRYVEANIRKALQELRQQALEKMPELNEFNPFGVSFDLNGYEECYVSLVPSSLYPERRFFNVAVSDPERSASSDLERGTAAELLAYLDSEEAITDVFKRACSLREHLS